MSNKYKNNKHTHTHMNVSSSSLAVYPFSCEKKNSKSLDLGIKRCFSYSFLPSFSHSTHFSYSKSIVVISSFADYEQQQQMRHSAAISSSELLKCFYRVLKMMYKQRIKPHQIPLPLSLCSHSHSKILSERSVLK